MSITQHMLPNCAAAGSTLCVQCRTAKCCGARSAKAQLSWLIDGLPRTGLHGLCYRCWEALWCLQQLQSAQQRSRADEKGAPELPPPMTITRLPTKGFGVRYPCECETSPVKLPLNLGHRGSQWCPHATTTDV